MPHKLFSCDTKNGAAVLNPVTTTCLIELICAMEYMEHLKQDKTFASIVNEPIHREIKLHKNISLRLMASIMSQQLSTKVAKVIYHRFLELYNGKEPTPQQVLDTPFEQLRGIGLSNAKTQYVKNVASFCIENKITDKKLLKMHNDDILELLTQIKGVGKWTVEMLLMFSLGREDVFAVDDLGLQQSMIKLYKIKTTDKKKRREKLLKISEKWIPYRTFACLYLWNWKDEGKD